MENLEYAGHTSVLVSDSRLTNKGKLETNGKLYKPVA